MNDMELVTKDFLSEQFEHLAQAMGVRFDSIDTRLDDVDHRLDGIDSHLAVVDSRLDDMNGRLGIVENSLDDMNGRLGRVEYNLFELSETLEAEMQFTSDLRDDLSRRVHALETKGA